MFFLALCLLVWHRQRAVTDVGKVNSRFLDGHVAQTYPKEERERPLVHPHMVVRGDDDGGLDLGPKAVQIDTTHDQNLEARIDTTEDRHPPVELAPDKDHVEEQPPPPDSNAEKVQLGLNTKKEIQNEEPEDDELPESGSGSERSQRKFNQSPPELVREASQKLIDQHLSPAVKANTNPEDEPPLPEDSNSQRRFPTYSQYAALEEKAEGLPDIIHTPFEDAVSDVDLEGWEDLWFSDAELDTAKRGTIKETKIDFVYTCKRSQYEKWSR